MASSSTEPTGRFDNERKVWFAEARRLESASRFGSMVTRLYLPLGLAALAFGLGGGLLSGCSVLIDVDNKQCATNQDCEALGPAFSGATCEADVCVVKSPSGGGSDAGGAPNMGVDELVCEKPEPSGEEKVKYTFAPIYIPGSEPEDTSFQIKACNPGDLECSSPVDGPFEVNAGEPHDFSVPVGWQGYFDVRNQETMSALVFMGRPILEDTVGWNITMPTPVLVAQLSLATGETVNAELGIIIAVARDCDAVPIEGVQFSNSKEGLQYYFVNNFPDTSLKETAAQGAVGFANVPISTTTLTATMSTGQELTRAIIRVKPNTVSLVELFP